MLVTVRNRRGIISAVEDFSTQSGEVSQLVHIEYMDSDGPAEDAVLWEREPVATLVEPRSLPRVDADAPMQPFDFAAVQHAARWLALSPFLPDQRGSALAPAPMASPLFGAIKIEDFQLVPLVRALKMPRVSILLADDVGLGKSVEAGLILNELIMRRRIRRVLVLCPAWLRYQWRKEMKTKFSLTFDIVDHTETHALRKRLGLDANPWRIYPRLICSYHYLKQPDILEEFRSVCQSQRAGTATLPWDLLIVDEAHNCMPSNVGEDSDVSRMLTEVARYFEHKIFLTATPHNGYSQCFTGLLEQLDPVRFTKKNDLTRAEQDRVQEIVIRRLKKEIIETDEALNRPARFANRHINPALPLYFDEGERNLSRAFENFRIAVKDLFSRGRKAEQMAGFFAVEVLNKRLLSCPYAFADSWYRLKEGLAQDEEATEKDVRAAERSLREDTDDDAEAESRQRHAARITGAWLRKLRDSLATFIKAIDDRLHHVGLVPDNNGNLPNPTDDARLDRLLDLIEQKLRQGKTWRADERLIVFTEYKTTLDYLDRRLRDKFPDEPRDRVLLLYGGSETDKLDREEIMRAFNDADHPVRILIGTDAASEGINLQETARYVLHYDIPWNPSRLDQRNGRLDRHGQARDVHVFHFSSEDDADLTFLSKVVRKVEQIRTDLGSLSELFDAAFERRFRDRQATDIVDQMLEEDIKKRKRRRKADLPKTEVSGAEEQRALEAFIREIDFSPEAFRSTLEVGLGLNLGGFHFDGPDTGGRFRLLGVPDHWKRLVDSELRLPTKSDSLGPLPNLVFDSKHFIHERDGRVVFRPAKDTVLLHLGHPIVRQALLRLSRARFPGTEEAQTCSRWIARYGEAPLGAEALLLITVEELAVNELREPFHHWVRTLRFPIQGGRLGTPLAHIPAADDRSESAIPSPEDIGRARDLWSEVWRDVETALAQRAVEITSQIREQLARDLENETRNQQSLFADRRRELAKELQKQERDIQKRFDEALEEAAQLDLLTGVQRLDTSADAIRDELERHRRHHQEMKEFLEREERRVLQELLPKRFALHASAQVFPVTVEICLPVPTTGGGR
jgi:superfamily II DNA or RNA helicase